MTATVVVMGGIGTATGIEIGTVTEIEIGIDVVRARGADDKCDGILHSGCRGVDLERSGSDRCR
jgi:hypothetical protein